MSVVVLVVTHGGAAKEMVSTVGALLGETAVVDFEAIEVRVGEPKASILARLNEAMERRDQGDGVLVAIDLFGSTPTNCALDLHRQNANHRLTVLTGVSLPMLLKLATARPQAASPHELAEVGSQTALRSIRIEGGEGAEPGAGPVKA